MTIDELKETAHRDPERAFQVLLDDLCTKLRETGVSEFLLEGVQIAMQMAYRLGEQVGQRK